MSRKVELVIDVTSDAFSDNLPLALACVLRKYADELEDDAFTFDTERPRETMDVIMRIPLPDYVEDARAERNGVLPVIKLTT